MAAISVFILGSCVSRDPFEYAKEGDYKLVAYYARTSFASLGASPCVDEGILENIESDFQRRVVRADMDKSVFVGLIEKKYDVILIDLIDERFAISMRGDSIHTVSTEYKRALYKPNAYKIYPFDSSEKIKHWEAGLQKLASFLKKNKIDHKVVVNKVFWTYGSDSNDALKDKFSKERVASVNQALEAMYDDIKRCIPKARFVTYAENELRADPAHKWGYEPFHYVKQNQLKLLHSIKKIYQDMQHEAECLEHVEDDCGRRMYYKYTPAKVEGKSPLLVILHGHGYGALPSKYKNEKLNILAPIDGFGVDCCGAWWLGESGNYFVKDLLHALIEKKINKTSGELYFWGSSMGGFGALLHGILLQAKAVYANIPQVRLLGSTYSNKGMHKYFSPIFNGDDVSIHNDVAQLLERQMTLGELKNVPLFFVAQSRYDYEEYLEEQSLYFFKKCLELGVNIHYEVFPVKGHALMMSLNQAVEKMLNTKADKPEPTHKKLIEIDQKRKDVGLSYETERSRMEQSNPVLALNKVSENVLEVVCNSPGENLRAYRLLRNGSVMHETKYITSESVRFSIGESGVYQAVCLFRSHARILSRRLEIKDDFGAEERIDGVENLVRRANQAEKSLKYIYELEKEKYEQLLKDKFELFGFDKMVGHLIGICRLEKRMHARYTDFSRKCAELALQTKPCDKTLYFYLESHLLNLPPDKVSAILLELRKNRKLDERCQSMLELHEAALHGVRGEWLECDRRLKLLGANNKADIYWQSDLIVTDGGLGSGESHLRGRGIGIQGGVTPKRYLVSVSADMNYFVRYARFFLESFKESCGAEAGVHLFLVNCEEHEVERLLTEWGVRSVVATSYYATPEGLDYKPVSATLRLIAVSELLERFNVPVFFSEIDCLVKRSMLPLVEKMAADNYDQLVRQIGAILPWQRYTCGFGGYMPTKNGRDAARLLRNYCLGLFNSKSKLMWADQCALEGSIRYAMIDFSGYRFYVPALGEVNEFIFTPTGSNERKEFALRKQEAG